MAAPLRHPHTEAGGICRRLSLAAYREKLKGRVPVDDRTELLCAFHEVFLDLFVGHALREAEASVKLAEQLSAPLAAAAARRALEVLNKLATPGDGAPKAEERIENGRQNFGGLRSSRGDTRSRA